MLVGKCKRRGDTLRLSACRKTYLREKFPQADAVFSGYAAKNKNRAELRSTSIFGL